MAYCKVEFNTGFTVISNELMRDKRISLKAKGLQALILSLPPEWDMTIEGLSAICIECSDTISSILIELEAAGYLSRYRERNSNGRYGPMQYTFFQSPIHNKPIRKISGRVKSRWEISGQLSKEQSNKEESKKDYPDILSINQADTIDKIRIYRSIIYANIDYEILREQLDRQRLDEIVDIMLECIWSSAKSIIIGKEAVPQELVQARFLKINSSHIEYVLSCLDRNTTKIRNIKAYLMTTLYNAPSTISNYYTAEVNHDLYGTE